MPAGAATLEVFYSGLDPQQIALEVRGGQNLERDVSLTNKATYGDKAGAVKLDPFRALGLEDDRGRGARDQRAAVRRQHQERRRERRLRRRHRGQRGRFMKFLPGVTIEYSDASPNAVAVRGFDPNIPACRWTARSSPTASGSAANRGFLFTQVSVNNMSRIEVTKVPTPANPPTASPARWNMVSKSAFERSKAQFNYRVVPLVQ